MTLFSSFVDERQFFVDVTAMSLPLRVVDPSQFGCCCLFDYRKALDLNDQLQLGYQFSDGQRTAWETIQKSLSGVESTPANDQLATNPQRGQVEAHE